MGPMICERQRQRAVDIVVHSVQAGAEVVCGGGARRGAGYFFEPTILTRVTADMRVMREEVFAPVLVVTAFPETASMDAVAAMANDTVYGLSAKVWARDVGVVHGMIARLETGQVIVNGGGGEAVLPFGGVKLSGMGGRTALPASRPIPS
jgi:phenylacetaldehyde dehydrogenase